MSARAIRNGLEGAHCAPFKQVRGDQDRKRVWFGPGVSKADRDAWDAKPHKLIEAKLNQERADAQAKAEAALLASAP